MATRYYHARITDTGSLLDGLTALVSTWDYTDHQYYHLSGWADEDDEAVMTAMYQAEQEAGWPTMPLAEFAQLWKDGDYDAPGPFCFKEEEVHILEEIKAPPEEGIV